MKLTIDNGDTAISNTPIERDVDGAGDWLPDGKHHTVTFETTPKMSTYLLAFMVGDFQCTSGEQDGVKLRVCATPDKVALTPFAMNIAKFALHYYDNYFGIHYPLKKLDFIGIPDFEAGAMENFGAITFRETDLLLDPRTATFRAQRNATLAIVHEMAHQWFGDLVTMQWWDNIWLNEGFATWMENKCTAAMHPEWNIPQYVAADNQRTLNIDAQPTTRAIRASADTPDEIEQLFDSIAYGKAGAMLLMVENYLGEETFRKGVHAYLAAHEYGNATAEDFWNAQTEVSHKPVDKIMESHGGAAGRAHPGIWPSRRWPGPRRAVALLPQPRHHARSPTEMDLAGLLQSGRERSGLPDSHTLLAIPRGAGLENLFRQRGRQGLLPQRICARPVRGACGPGGNRPHSRRAHQPDRRRVGAGECR